MASNLENTDFTQCPVCFEPYTETGDHIPRILPCHCALCQSCILKLIQNKQLECPVDRKKHPARHEEKSFPQNKYILSFLRKEFQPKETDYDVCPEHNQKMMLFCKDEKCQKTICAMCMGENHLTHLHLVVNVLEEEKRKLNSELEPLLETLNSYTEELQRAEIQVEKECENLLKKLTARKAKILAELKEKLSNATDNMATLSDIKEKIEKGSTHQELMDKLEFVNVMKDLCAEAKEPVKIKFYQLVENEMEIEKAEEEGEIDDAPEENLRKRKKRSLYIIEAKELFSMRDTTCLRDIEVLSDGDIVVVDNYQMTRYDRDSGEVLYSTKLEKWAGGIVEVNLGGRPTLAVSYNRTVSTPTVSIGDGYRRAASYRIQIPRNETINGLKFFDTPNMYKSTDVDVPETNSYLEKMCRFSDSRILGQSRNERKNLKLINCETETPQLELVMMSLSKDSELKDMCVTKDTKGQEIVVCTYGIALHVENLKGKALWSIGGAIGGKKPLKCISLTCDQRGHIFVCDDNNNCVDIFSIDGLHLGSIVSKGERGIDNPYRVRWCEKTSSLVVVHCVENTSKISALKIHYNSGSFS